MRALRSIFALCAFLCAAAALPQAVQKSKFKGIAFDYFVLFNPNSVMPAVEKIFPGKGSEFTKIWRGKQFEYGFLRSLTNRHADFFKVTEDALVYTAQFMKLKLGDAEKKQLLDAYLHLQLWPDSIAALKRLKASGIKIITIANFSKKMLLENAKNAGIADLFDELLSTEKNGTYKPDPQAYALGMKTLNLPKDQIVFAAFGGWDAYGAKSFGYATYWVNRFNLPPENLGISPDAASNDIQGLLDFVFAK